MHLEKLLLLGNRNPNIFFSFVTTVRQTLQTSSRIAIKLNLHITYHFFSVQPFTFTKKICFCLKAVSRALCQFLQASKIMQKLVFSSVSQPAKFVWLKVVLAKIRSIVLSVSSARTLPNIWNQNKYWSVQFKSIFTEPLQNTCFCFVFLCRQKSFYLIKVEYFTKNYFWVHYFFVKTCGQQVKR